MSARNLKHDSIFRLIFGMALVFAFAQNVPGPLIPVFTREFGLGYDDIGYLFFAGLFLGLVSASVFGHLSDIINKKKIIITGATVLMISVTGIVISYNTILFIIFFCLVNIGIAILEAGMITSVSELGGDSRSHSLTVYTRFLGIGSLLGPILLFFIFHYNIQWRFIYLLISITLIIFIILLARIKYPESHSSQNYPGINYKKLLKPVIIYGSLAVIFNNGVIMIAGAWLTTYLLAFRMYIGYSTLMVALYWGAIVLGRIITEHLIRRMDENLYLILITSFTAVSLMSIAFSGILIVKIIFIVLLGISLGGIFPLVLSMMFSAFPGSPGRIFSILGVIGYGSVMVFQLLTGIIAEKFGEANIIYLQLGNSILLLVFVILMIRSIRAR